LKGTADLEARLLDLLINPKVDKALKINGQIHKFEEVVQDTVDKVELFFPETKTWIENCEKNDLSKLNANTLEMLITNVVSNSGEKITKEELMERLQASVNVFENSQNKQEIYKLNQ
jgi:hypothetical protein